jgi:competence/damage-inducible protein CinA-like protein
MNAEILAIGTELLLGEIVDTNTAVIARALRSVGIDLYRTVIVGDNAERIAQAVREAVQRSDVVITTGGLGPTVDDASRQGVARAFGVPTEFRPELWEQVQERFTRYGRKPTENNRQQAMLPVGALAVENPVGTAPAFMLETASSVVIALPGVPSEMTYLLETAVLPYLHRRLGLSAIIKSRVLKTTGMGESWLDERVADLERGANPTVGLSAHAGQVDVRITSKAASEAEANQMLNQVETTLRERLGTAVFGVDSETLEQVAARMLAARGWRLALVEHGTGGGLASLMEQHADVFAGGRMLPERLDASGLAAAVDRARREFEAQAALGVVAWRESDRAVMLFHLATPEECQDAERNYGGPPVNAAQWAINMALDFLRRRLA